MTYNTFYCIGTSVFDLFATFLQPQLLVTSTPAPGGAVAHGIPGRPGVREAGLCAEAIGIFSQQEISICYMPCGK